MAKATKPITEGARMEKKYTGVGYGRTQYEAEQNARASIRSQIDDDLTIDATGNLAMGAMHGIAGSLPYVWKIICGFLWAFAIFARGFFFAPLPSLIAGAIFVSIIYSSYYLFNYGDIKYNSGAGEFFGEILMFIINAFLLSFGSAYLFDRFFNKFAGWILNKENSIVKSSGFFSWYIDAHF